MSDRDLDAVNHAFDLAVTQRVGLALELLDLLLYLLVAFCHCLLS